ncbi:MAG: hypothetical protein HY317_04840 [Acidobacteria bacterium]|nr:hypothetical protein [Acidobacteriota bacterium]
MASSKKKTKAKGKAKGKSAAAHKPAPKPAAPKPGKKAPAKPAAKAPAAAPARGAPAAGAAAGPAGTKPQGHHPAPRKSSRRDRGPRRGASGEIVGIGEILIPGGPQTPEEIQYFFRGCVAAEHPNGPAGVEELLSKRPGATDPESLRTDFSRVMHAMAQRFDGSIEPLLPGRPQTARRTFQTVVERAKLRRREIGAFLRGLDIGRTESSHMDSHGEASLQSLMEWAARLENLAEADEPQQADYAQFHRGLDQLDNTTEALILDVEATLRRLRDRVRS